MEFFKCKALFEHGDRYHRGWDKNFDINIPAENINSKEKFHPVDARGNDLEEIECQFDGQGTCMFTYQGERNYKNSTFTPKILFHKGDKKDDINARLIMSLSQSVSETREKLALTLKKVEKQFKSYESKLNSPFVPADKISLAISGIAAQIEGLQLRIKDCERLEELCR